MTRKSKRKKEINSCLKREYDFLEKQIRALETIDNSIENEIAVKIEVPFVVNQKDIDQITNYVKNEIKPIFKKMILIIDLNWLDERVFATITHD